MLQQLSAAWRTRRVVIIGGRDEVSVPLTAWLTLLGARPAVLAEQESPEALFRALTDGRVSAVLVSRPPATDTLRTEIREAGVPLLLLCQGEDGQDAALGALIAGARFFSEGTDDADR